MILKNEQNYAGFLLLYIPFSMMSKLLIKILWTSSLLVTEDEFADMNML